MSEFRANVTIPEEARAIFHWLTRYDQRFEGSPAAVAAHLIRVGAQALYEQGLSQAEPYPAELQAELEGYAEEALAAATKR
jgi:hypothetical protein